MQQVLVISTRETFSLRSCDRCLKIVNLALHALKIVTGRGKGVLLKVFYSFFVLLREKI